jgi:hypothetical protein
VHQGLKRQDWYLRPSFTTNRYLISGWRYILCAVHTGEVSMQNVKDFFQETTSWFGVWSKKKKMKISPDKKQFF